MLIAADLTYQNGELRTGMAIETDGQHVMALRPLGQDTPDQRVHILMPACTDLQVNGGGGVMLNNTPTADGIRQIRAAHLRLGTGAIMPTVITDAPDVLDAAAEAIQTCYGEPGILGLHIEGPHINPARRGTHSAQHIRPLDQHTMRVLKQLRAAHVPVLLTLAPETCDAGLIRDAVSMGVIVSAGHSAATAPQTRKALANGVTMFTHLYNAMPPMTSRDPGILGAAILSDAYCGLIADGIHVSWDMIRIAMASRPHKDRMFLVSDAMATVGGPDHFNLYGQEIRVQDGALINAQGALAGAHIDMVTALVNLHKCADVPLAQSIAMATDIPRRAMRLPPVQIIQNCPLNTLVMLDENLKKCAFDTCHIAP